MVCVVKTGGCTASGNEVWKAEGKLKKVRAIPETQTTRDITSAGEVRATGHPQQLFIANAQSFSISKPATSPNWHTRSVNRRSNFAQPVVCTANNLYQFTAVPKTTFDYSSKIMFCSRIHVPPFKVRLLQYDSL
jgi:flagellar basal body rod protein FlgG